jgi:hypothetical protein
MKTSIPQIFDEVEKAGSKESKIKVLRTYDTPVLKGILQINFNTDIKVHLPEGEPPFKKDTSIPTGYSETNLYTEFRRFYIWLNESINLTRARKEQLFVQLLEGIHWTEAEVVCLAKDRKLQTKYKSLKEDLVREAFPDVLPPKKVPVPAKKKEASLNK